MDAIELRDRYISDVRAARTAFENGTMDRVEYDNTIYRIDNRFFDELEMLAISTPASELERILQYS